MLNNRRVREAILRGIEKANQTHIKWTRNFWVSDYGAEALIQVKIAEEIFCADPSISVWLEVNLSEFANGKAAYALKHAGMTGQARPDICTFRNDWKMPHVIEVKRNWSNGPISADFERCARLAHYIGGDLAAGLEGVFVAVFLQSTMRDKRKDFFQADGESATDAKQRVECLLKRKVVEALRFRDVRVGNKLAVLAEVGPEEAFNGVPNWLLEDPSLYANWRWRAAVIQFTSQPSSIPSSDSADGRPLHGASK